MERFAPPRPVGTSDWVLWYRQGDMNTRPYAALVTADDARGILPLAIWGPNSMVPELRSGVHHCSDPWCQDHHESIRDSGVWDYKPGLVPTSMTEQLKQRIFNLADKGRNSREIAEVLTAETGQSISWQRVSTVIRNRPKEPVET